MKTTTDYLILNQACADLVITLTQSINVLHFSTSGSSWFGGTLGLITCNLYIGARAIPSFISIWILVAIAVERFYAVTRPLQSSPISQHLKKTITVLWFIALVSTSISLVEGSLKKAKQSYFCELETVLSNWKAVNVIGITFIYVLPILVIALLYTIVCLNLWSRDVPGEGANQNHGQGEAMKTARKVTRMMIVIVILYLLCWLPIFTVLVLQIFGSVKISVSLLMFCGWLTVSYSGLNPYIYFAFSQKFRKPLKKLFGNCFCKICPLNRLTSRSQSVELSKI